MRILHVTKKYKNALGGDAAVVTNLEKLQRRAGHEVFILTSNSDDIVNANYVTKYGCNVEWPDLDSVTLKRVVSLPALLYRSFVLLLRKRPDIIHSHSLDMGFVVSIPARILRIPIIHTCHGVVLDETSYSVWKRYVEVFLLKHAGFKRITVLSPAKVEELDGHQIRNALFLPNGVDLDFWRRDQNGRSGEMFTFLSVGRLEDQKGFDYLLEAVADLRRFQVAFRVIIAGDGTRRGVLLERCRDLGLAGTVEFVGGCSAERLRELYRHADAFVLPSVWEGFPLTILEAWAIGLPVVTTTVGSIAELCRDGHDALMVKPRRSDLLARAMRMVLSSDEMRRELIAGGTQKVQELYGLHRVSELLLTEYSTVSHEYHIH